MKLSYQFPIVYLDEENPEESEIVYDEASLTPLHLDREPYEIIIEARGYRFHILCGSQINGNFLCIPDWHVGCELAALNDISWNMDSILHSDSRLEYEDATAIVYALALLSQSINDGTTTGA